MRPSPAKPSRATRVALSATAGVGGAAIVAIVGPWWLAPLAAWDVAAALLLGWTWGSLWPLDATRTAKHATQESPSRVNTDLLLIGGSIISLGAVGLVLVRATSEAGLEKGLLVATGVASIVLAWAVVHTVYTLRYAKLYYQGTPEGVDFNEDDSPCYGDFAYLALTIGMTFQVSDTDLTTKAMRRLALRHALLSYMFGALIIATTINLIAGLGSSQ
ncbi:MAG TPA: DUF1345 domain-containing protein [Solirubrobacteraceae bacterium]|nr:DUF1345 domain-containing protein [Solirubrobacteraceae bacterium]